MNRQTMWWLQNTPAGRRVYERVMPRSAIPPPMRRQMCRERGHDLTPSGDQCLRCGERLPKEEK